MRQLKLYPDRPQAAIASVVAEAHDSECVACPHCTKARRVCMPPEGKPHGVLVVGEWPTRVEDQTGRPFTGATARYVRSAVAKHWDGPVAYDYALRCSPGADATKTVKDKHLDACRPYGRQVLADVRPERIIALGPAAYYSILGRRPPQLSVRKGHGWYFDEDGRHVPVFLVMAPALIHGNRFVAAQFESDMKHALTCELPQFDLMEARTTLVTKPSDAKRAAMRLMQEPWIVYDVETFGQQHNPDFRLESVTVLGANADRSYTWTREALRDPAAVRPLRRILNSRPAVTQNGKYDDQSVMLALGADPPTGIADTRLWRRMSDPDAGASLAVLGELVGMGGHKVPAEAATDAVCAELRRQARGPQVTPKGKPRLYADNAFDVDERTLAQVRDGADPMWFAFGYVEAKTLYRYNALDVWSTRAVHRKLLSELSPEVARMWEESVRDANKALRMIEFWGFAVDRGAIVQFERYCDGKLAEAKKRLAAYPGVNWDSPKQIQDLLYNRLGLSILKQTKTGQASTDDEVLEKLAGKHPVVDALRMHRKYSKLNGTYARGMLPHVRADGRIHPSFLLDGAGTGRLSCAAPNLQNIPRAKGSPDAQFARACFIAPPGFTLLEIDFSQLELRIAAMLARDPVMIADFNAGIDIHRNNARECCFVWGMTQAQWDALSKDEQDPFRSQIKTLTFGRLYGKTMRGMSKELGCSVEQVEQIDKRIWGRYRRLDAWIKERLQESRRSGVAWTWWRGHPGRCRPISKIGSQDEGLRKHAERTSWNTPIQGTAAEFCTASLWPIVEWIIDSCVPAKVVCTVHDSILVEVRNDALAETAWNMRRIMEGHDSEGVPIVVDMKRGQTWGSLEDYQLPEAA